MPTTYNVQSYKYKAQRQVIWAPEFAPGSPGTGTAGTAPATAFSEPCKAVEYTINRSTYTDDEYSNFIADEYDLVEITHHSELVLTLPMRETGVAERVLAAIGGDYTNAGAREAISTLGGVSTHTFTIGPSGAQCNRFHFWVIDGDTSNPLEFANAVCQSIEFSGAPNQPLMAKLTFLAWHPLSTGDAGFVAIPTGGNLTAVAHLLRTYGFQGAFTLFNNSGTDYALKPYNHTLTLTRNIEVYESNAQNTLSPWEFLPGNLKLELGVDAIYSGLATGTPLREFLQFKQLGDSSHKHVVKFSNSSGTTPAYSFECDFWPAKWTQMPKVTEQGNALKISGGKLSSFQDRTTATGGTPAYTPVSSIVLVNSLATGMIA